MRDRLLQRAVTALFRGRWSADFHHDRIEALLRQQPHQDRTAPARHGRPEIFNTDQGSQFAGFTFMAVLRGANMRISMDGRGRWMDNIFIERLWRSLKYECVFLHAFEAGSELRVGLTSWMGHYNAHRPHSGPAGRTPDEVYSIKETALGVGPAPPPVSRPNDGMIKTRSQLNVAAKPSRQARRLH